MSRYYRRRRISSADGGVGVFEYLAYKGLQGGEYGVGVILEACGFSTAAGSAVVGLEWVDDARNRLGVIEAGVAEAIHTPSLLIDEVLPPAL